MQIYNAVKHVFREKRYIFVFFVFALFFFWLFVFIPVATIPGNSFAFQLSIFRPKDYFLMALLALLVGLNFAMNIYIWRARKASAVCSSAASGVTSGIASAFASIVGSATCASCLTGLFAAFGLGFGSVVFILEHQTQFLILAAALLAVSLYFTSRKINRVCAHTKW